MRRTIAVFLPLVVAALGASGAAAAAVAPAALESLLTGPFPLAGGEPLREPEALARFYEERAFEPAWTEPRDVRALLLAVAAAPDHGLVAERYHESALAASPAAQPPAHRELLLSDAFVHLARHLAAGAVDPSGLHPRFERGDVPPDPVRALDQALRRGDVADTLARLAPPHAGYAGLRAGLRRLEGAAQAGGWPELPGGDTLRSGDRSPDVPALRARLAWPAAPPARAEGDAERFDEDLAEALRAFQERHGLAADGVLGTATRAALATPVAARIDQVRANLERWRWEPRRLGARSVRVNVAAFALRAYEGEEATLGMPVVVGCAGWKTPRVSGDITHVVLNPAWEVPRSIAVREMLPRARRDPGYFEEQGLELLEAKGGDGARAVDPASIDWEALDGAGFPYRLRQPPGPRNPMGHVKFVFANPFGVYLHGTPGRESLKKPARDLSHGCVRVEDEVALAAWALAPDPAWSRERLEGALETAREEPVWLPEPLPVHVRYFTAEADADGSLRFYGDPYAWDAPLLAALRDATHPPRGASP